MREREMKTERARKKERETKRDSLQVPTKFTSVERREKESEGEREIERHIAKNTCLDGDTGVGGRGDSERKIERKEEREREREREREKEEVREKEKQIERPWRVPAHRTSGVTQRAISVEPHLLHNSSS